MKRLLNITIITVLLVLAPVALFAQDELTLESLAETVTALTERVAAVEAKLEPVTTADGVCIQYSNGQLQRETVTKYLDAFEENVGSLVSLKAVHHDGENGLTIYHFEEAFTDRSVTETWRACEFLDVGEWVEEE